MSEQKRRTLAELLSATPDDETVKGEQEPVCFLTETAWNYEIANWGDPNGFPVYTAPPKKEWVGLTEDEKQFFKAMGFSGIDIVEAKLKEKNT